jgi:hypothetical protein
MSTNTFSIGDKVEWTSSSNGSTTKKVGYIETTIPAGTNLTREQCKETGSYALPRPHESYLVHVPTKTGGGKGKLYWPLVSKLRKI